MSELTFIGLDVHARSVWAGCSTRRAARSQLLGAGAHRRARALAARPRRVRLRRLRGRSHRLRPRSGLHRGPHPLPRGRAIQDPQSPRRAHQDRSRDALRLAKLLRLGELVAVRVPSACEEAARDLVRAREDARADSCAPVTGSPAVPAPGTSLGGRRLDAGA